MVVLTYACLGRNTFEVYPHEVYTGTRVEDILEAICERWDVSDDLRNSDFWLVRNITTPNASVQWEADFFQLKEPIPFDKVDSNPWLLYTATNLADYATKVFRAVKLRDVWTNHEENHLHAVLRIGCVY